MMAQSFTEDLGDVLMRRAINRFQKLWVRVVVSLEVAASRQRAKLSIKLAVTRSPLAVN